VSESPPRLGTIFPSYDPPLYFVTFNTRHRRRVLANQQIHEQFVGFSRAAEDRDITVGRYVIMPDHIHLFVRGHFDFVLTQWVRLLKRSLSTALGVPPPHWQKGFFDHLIRHAESYSDKWEYVRHNPERAGLVIEAEDGPWQGEIVPVAM
jgi:putative transposase